jgi:phosphoribosylanthranilate isomerase
MPGNEGRATAVKICGITRVEDGLAAAHAGAHAVGLVFHRASPRFVQAAQARAVSLALPPFVTAVGLFVDLPAVAVASLVRQVPLQLLQFHGDEDPAYCESFGMPFIKAVRMKRGVDLLQFASRFSAAKGLLLDTYTPAAPGGTGESFDWDLVPPRLPLPIVLAGGLTPDNVAAAVRAVRPWAVDVSSGVEHDKGIKDADKIAAFIRGVRDADV